MRSYCTRHTCPLISKCANGERHIAIHKLPFPSFRTATKSLVIMSDNARACSVTVSPAANTEIQNRVPSTCKLHWSQAKDSRISAVNL